MSIIYYAIQLTTDTTQTDTDYGLNTGVFRWVTGRPGYDGSPTYPVNEDGSNNTSVWYEGLLSEDGLGTVTRSIDISTTGQYGTLSGFDFSLLNYNKFMEFIYTNDIYIIGREVKFYVVIDNVFYQAWNGVVGNAPFSLTEYTISCVDNYKNIHKPIPPEYVNPTLYNPGENSVGDTLPVSFGDIAFAKLYSVQTDPSFLTLVKNEHAPFQDSRVLGNGLIETFTNNAKPAELKQAAAYTYEIVTPGVTYKRLGFVLITFGISFAANELVGKYMMIRGEGAPEETIYRIQSNLASFQKTITCFQSLVDSTIPIYLTRIYLEDPIDTPVDTDYNAWLNSHMYIPLDYVYPYSGDEVITCSGDSADSKVWWFSIANLETTLILSQRSITEFHRKNGQIQLWIYDDSSKTFKKTDNSLIEISASNIDNNQPGIKLISESINIDGDIKYIYPVSPFAYRVFLGSDYSYNYISLGQYTAYEIRSWESDPVLTDYDSTTGLTITWNQGSLAPLAYIDLTLPYEVLKENIENVYIAFDFETNFNDPCLLQVSYYYLDPYNNTTANKTDGIEIDIPSGDYSVWGLPERYYEVNGSRPGSPDVYIWNLSEPDSGKYIPFREKMKIDSNIFSEIKSGMRSPIIRVEFKIVRYSTPLLGKIDINEISFLAEKKIKTQDGNFYARIKGEPVNGYETDNVYRIFQHILETYDGIDPSNIDYGNLPYVRQDWKPCGRQLTDRKNSYEYLNELCNHSFVGLFPTRAGKRKLTAWIDQTSNEATFNQDNILRDSIKKYERTDPSKVYNDFFCQYGWNNASEEFERALIVTRTDQSSFPSIDNTSWKTYVSGVNPDSYADASNLWATAHRGYNIINFVRQNDKKTQELYWYTDDQQFNNERWTGASVDDPAYRFLSQMVEWTSLQKEDTQFDIALDSTNVTRELLDQVVFNDTFFTNSTDRTGWITQIDINPKDNLMTVNLTLTPRETQLLTYDTIMERGTPANDPFNLIDETGTRDSTIIEG